MTIRIALAGNPNVGKSVIFNNLVPGARQHVGNWPGKTVEKKSGKFKYKNEDYEIIDLPGCYSLTARAIDELVARTYIIEEKPDVVVNIVDASNIERNLYLTLLLMELEVNLVVALNQMDVADSKGYVICSDTLREKLGVPVVETIATQKVGMESLKEAIQTAVRNPKPSSITYSAEVEEIISDLVEVLKEDLSLVAVHPPRWMAIKLIEGDQEVSDIIANRDIKSKIEEVLA
jgi:ferrous iron transport protein B